MRARIFLIYFSIDEERRPFKSYANISHAEMFGSDTNRFRTFINVLFFVCSPCWLLIMIISVLQKNNTIVRSRCRGGYEGVLVLGEPVMIVITVLRTIVYRRYYYCYFKTHKVSSVLANKTHNNDRKRINTQRNVYGGSHAIYCIAWKFHFKNLKKKKH